MAPPPRIMSSIAKFAAQFIIAPLSTLGCAGPEEQPAKAVHEDSTLSGYLAFARDSARRALASIGIEREVVSARLLPMAINRLEVEVQSQVDGVHNLQVTFWDPGRGWELEGPSLETVKAWLIDSSRRS